MSRNPVHELFKKFVQDDRDRTEGYMLQTLRKLDLCKDKQYFKDKEMQQTIDEIFNAEWTTR